MAFRRTTRRMQPAGAAARSRDREPVARQNERSVLPERSRIQPHHPARDGARNHFAVKPIRGAGHARYGGRAVPGAVLLLPGVRKLAAGLWHWAAVRLPQQARIPQLRRWRGRRLRRLRLRGRLRRLRLRRGLRPCDVRPCGSRRIFSRHLHGRTVHGHVQACRRVAAAVPRPAGTVPRIPTGRRHATRPGGLHAFHRRAERQRRRRRSAEDAQTHRQREDASRRRATGRGGRRRIAAETGVGRTGDGHARQRAPRTHSGQNPGCVEPLIAHRLRWRGLRAQRHLEIRIRHAERRIRGLRAETRLHPHAGHARPVLRETARIPGTGDLHTQNRPDADGRLLCARTARRPRTHARGRRGMRPARHVPRGDAGGLPRQGAQGAWVPRRRRRPRPAKDRHRRHRPRTAGRAQPHPLRR